jgi:hypothetical protein
VEGLDKSSLQLPQIPNDEKKKKKKKKGKPTLADEGI